MDHYSEQAIVDAMVQANADRALLAQLKARGLVIRDNSAWSVRYPTFIRDIESRVKPQVNLAIRPKRRRKR